MKLIYNIAATYNSGGMERVLANKANYLVNKGYEILIITTDQKNRAHFFDFDSRIRFIDLSINYEENNGKSFINKIAKYPIKQYLHKKRLKEVLLEEKADVVISMFCNDVSFINDIHDGSKKILEIHFSKYKRVQYGRKGLWHLADLYRSKKDESIVRKFDKFIVLTQEDKGYWGDLGNIDVISNARSFATTENAKLQDKKVLAVGRFSHQKGFDMLINTWASVCKHDNEWHLDIVGSGELNEEYCDLIKRNNISDRVSLIGHTNKISDMYIGASILAMSSRYEGLPMVLLEAQSYGLPVVSFSCKCGPADVINDNHDGFLVDEGNIDMFADSLLRIMKDDDLRFRFGKNAKTNSDRFDEEVIMNKWITLFENIVQR